MSISDEFFKKAMQRPAMAIDLAREYSTFEKNKLNDQSIKADAGKEQLTLVPRGIIREIAKIRGYGVQKYGTSESWRSVHPSRYRDAAFRHFLAYLDDPRGVDEESGLPHLSHLACNVAFLIELDKE